jgi:hypothetical protein
MQTLPTDTGRVDEERGNHRAFLSGQSTPQDDQDDQDDQDEDLTIDPDDCDRSERLKLALQAVSAKKLKSSFIDQIKLGNDEAALRVSAELTTRRIAPCFRGLPVKREWWSGNPDTDFIIMAADLQWLVSAYPDHRTEWSRAQSVFDPRKFKRAAQYLHWDGCRTAGQIAKALGLTEQQQRECAWIQCLHVERWRQRLHMRWPIAHAKIAAGIKAHDRRTEADQEATIKRRADLWLCAELADWKPQRTADLFAMLTGDTLPRNLVGKQLAKLPKVRRTDLFSAS